MTETSIPLHIGRAIRVGRATHDMTIAQLAAATGVHPCTIARTEKGRTMPTLRTLNKLIVALHLPPTILELAAERENAR
jgi:transcriptional regulator with XRE-family HTH domain